MNTMDGFSGWDHGFGWPLNIFIWIFIIVGIVAIAKWMANLGSRLRA